LTQRLGIDFGIEATFGQRHHMIADGGDLDVTACTERLLSKQLVT
jgi:hypothetical protein